MAAPADTTMRRTLQDLGLHDIYATLAAEEIDDSVFCDLQDGDLKELSISRGNRRKILTAIAALKARERGGWHPPPPPYSPGPPVGCVIGYGDGYSSTRYEGGARTTASGKQCQNWAITSPHMHTYTNTRIRIYITKMCTYTCAHRRI